MGTYHKGPPKACQEYLWMALAIASLQLSALRPLFKYSPSLVASVVATGAMTALACAVVWRLPRTKGRMTRMLASPWSFAFIVCGMASVTGVLYPYADGLKIVWRGSDQDDALILVVQHFWKDFQPYVERTYFNNPISTGPGWALLWTPLVLLNVYWLITPVAMMLLGTVLRRYSGSWRQANLTAIFLFVSPLTWELMVVGSDLVALGCFLATLAYAATRPQGSLNRTVGNLGAVLLPAAVASSRIVLAYVPLLLGLAAARVRQRWLVVALLGTSTCLGIHLLFLVTARGAYQPAHVLAKGARMIDSWVFRVSALLAATSLLLFWRQFSRQLQPLAVAWLGLAIPLDLVSVTDLLVMRHGDLASWEGANYLIVPLPILLVHLVSSRPCSELEVALPNQQLCRGSTSAL